MTTKNRELVHDQLVLMRRFAFTRVDGIVVATCRQCGMSRIASAENIRDGLVMELIEHAEAER